MKEIRWGVRLACAQKEIWSATELQKIVEERTGVRLSPQTLQAWFRGKPERIEVRTLTAILNALRCNLTDLIQFEPPSNENEARATREQAAHYRQKDFHRSLEPEINKTTKQRPGRPDTDAMFEVLNKLKSNPVKNEARPSERRKQKK